MKGSLGFSGTHRNTHLPGLSWRCVGSSCAVPRVVQAAAENQPKVTVASAAFPTMLLRGAGWSVIMKALSAHGRRRGAQ